jgi:hypothetical protein
MVFWSRFKYLSNYHLLIPSMNSYSRSLYVHKGRFEIKVLSLFRTKIAFEDGLPWCQPVLGRPWVDLDGASIADPIASRVFDELLRSEFESFRSSIFQWSFEVDPQMHHASQK